MNLLIYKTLDNRAEVFCKYFKDTIESDVFELLIDAPPFPIAPNEYGVWFWDKALKNYVFEIRTAPLDWRWDTETQLELKKIKTDDKKDFTDKNKLDALWRIAQLEGKV